MTKAEDFADIIVAWRNGAPVRLSDVAKVIDGAEETNQASWINGKNGVIIQVTRQPRRQHRPGGARTFWRYCPRLKPRCPPR